MFAIDHQFIQLFDTIIIYNKYKKELLQNNRDFDVFTI